MYKFQMQRLGIADDHEVVRPNLPTCIESVLMHSDALIDNILEGLALSLAQSKGKTKMMGQNSASKGASEKLLEQAGAVKVTFSAELRSAVYNNDAQIHETKPVVAFNDLQLFEENQIDASIEFALAQQEVSRCVDDVLPPLNALVSSLLGWITVQPQLNPIKPEAFVRALRETLVAHVPSEEARGALITPAAGLLGLSLQQLYAELTHWLRAHGVEAVGMAGVVGAGLNGGSRSPAETTASRTMVTLDKLRRLLTTEIDLGFGSSGGVKEFNHTLPASYVALEDMKLIEPMMKRLAQRADQHSRSVALLRAQARAERNDNAHGIDLYSSDGNGGKNLGRQLGDEVVRMMLETLLQDTRLLVKVRAQIGMLEPILIKLTSHDARFFNDRQHPARQFLDRITQRSLAYSNESNEGCSSFLKSVSGAVSALSRSTGEAAAFERVLQQLEKGWVKSEAAQRARHEEAARGLLRAEQRNLLAQRIAETFRERLVDKDVPEVIDAFLRGPWSQVVAESQLNCTDGSDDADGYFALVDDLIWSVQLRLAQRNRARLVELVPGLLIKIRQGLQLIGYPQERQPLFFDELITLHERVFEQSRMSVFEPSRAPHDSGHGQEDSVEDAESRFAEITPADEFWLAEQEAQESGYLADDKPVANEVAAPLGAVGTEPRVWSVSDLNIGAWVELMIDPNWVRAQLTWASPHRTLFMFISHGGLAHSMSRRTMERLRARDRIRIVSDGKLLDSALDAVAQAAMRNNLG